MPPPNDPEPDPDLHDRAERFLPRNRGEGLTGSRRPFDIYYSASGRPLTRHPSRFQVPQPADGETVRDMLWRGTVHTGGKLMQFSGAMAGDAARYLQIMQTSLIGDLARISPLVGGMTHTMNQVISETQYQLLTRRDHKTYQGGGAGSHIQQIGELIALSGAMNAGAHNHIAPTGML
jgi:hypothetical protein